MTYDSIHILGERGFLGRNLKRWFGQKGLLYVSRADVVINCRGWPDVAGCKIDTIKSMRSNNISANEAARHAKAVGAKFVQISTDYVFGGEFGGYTELHPPMPTTIYGKHKLEAEIAVKEICPDAIIIRTSALYGPGWRTGEWLNTQSTVDCWDCHNSPTYIDNLAEAIWEILTLGLSGKFHVAGPKASRFDFFLWYCQVFHPRPFELVNVQRPDDCLVPKDLSLNTELTRQHLSTPFADLITGMMRWKQLVKDTDETTRTVRREDGTTLLPAQASDPRITV